ncbi:MAG: DNA-3-methyladenine glycosylase family protein [Fusobacteriaceae bacterium]
MDFFKYGEKEIAYLKEKDEKLSKIIEKYGVIKRPITPDIFQALIESVIGQQISTKVAKKIIEKLKNLLNHKITCEKILEIDIEKLKECGMSERKIGYIFGIAKAGKEKTIDFGALSNLSNEEIISKLTTLNGVGVWTVEMLLIFSLNRMNILSFGDLAIRRGILKTYEIEAISKQELKELKDRYSPYESVASLYLWEESKSLNKIKK